VKNRLSFLNIIFFIFFINIELFAISDKIELTPQEQQWIKQNSTIKIAVMDYWDHDENGNNIHYDFIELISRYGELNIIPVTFKSWDMGYNKAKLGENINGILNLSWSKDREANDFYYTKAYDYTPCYIITKKSNSNITKFDDLEDKQVIVKKGSISNELLKNRSKSTKIVNLETEPQMYQKLSEDKTIDAMATYFINYDMIKQNNLKIVDVIYDRYGDISLGISKKNSELYSVISKVLATIPENEILNLRNKNKLDLSKDEEKFLVKNIPLSYTIKSIYNPLQYIDDLDNLKGISVDILKLIQAKTNINLNQNLSKNSSIELGVVKTSKNSQKYNFTSNSLFSTPLVFVSRKDTLLLNGFGSIENKKVAVIKGHFGKDILNDLDPTLKVIVVDDIKQALDKLDSKDIDILITNGIVAKYSLDEYEYSGLVISYKTIFNLEFKIAVSKDIPLEVVSILDKSIEALSQKDISDVVDKWTTVRVKEKTDWVFVFKIVGGVLVLLLIVFINNQKLKSLVNNKTHDIQQQKRELENILESFDKNVIFSKTDTNGIITHTSEAFCKMSGYTQDELIGKPHNIVRHPDMPKDTFRKIWASLKLEIPITKEIKNLRKDGTYYWVESKFSPDYDIDGKLVGYNAIRHDITSKKEVEELSSSLELKVQMRTKDLDETKKEVEQILSSILLPVLITDKNSRKIVYANKFAETQYDTKLEDMIGSSIEELYTTQGQSDELVNLMRTQGYIENLEQEFVTHSGKHFVGLLSVIPIRYKENESYIGMTTDITKQKDIEEQIRQMHKHTRDSIEYASLIQRALIPDNKNFEIFFKDYFALWNPKDIVGGDIYLFEQIDNDSCIILVIDCTGHGVPGAFVTMLVKAIERQISALINSNSFIEVSPSWILSYFNKTIKKLLKQEDADAISNAGFDGGVIYYNKKDKVLKFSGAETPLFYFTKDGEFKTIKGSRHSVGYKKSDANFEFKEHIIDLEEGMKFYLTTDGYLDQNGGEKDFPFGKKKFGKVVEENKNLPFKEQEKILLSTIEEYQGDQDRNDDITVIGFEI